MTATIDSTLPEKSLADQYERCRVATDAATQLEGLTNSLRMIAAKIDVQDAEGHGAAVLALAMRSHTLSGAIYCLLDDPAEPTEDLRELVTGGTEVTA